MPYTFDNILITTATGDAYLATDWGTSGTGFSLAHVPVNKIAYGDDSTTTRVTTSSPLPIYIYGSTGTVGISGTIFGAGNFSVINNGTTGFIRVGGTTFSTTLIGVTATIQGISGGTPVGITGTINIGNSIAIYGISGGTAIGITGGRRLSYTSDSVSVYGNVGISGSLNLTESTDSIRVYGHDGDEKIPTRLYGSDGTTLGVSGDALKVAVTNAGFTFTVNLGATVGVANYGGGLMIKGTGITSDSPVIVQGIAADGSFEVTATEALPVNVENDISIDFTEILASIGITGSIYTALNSVKTNTAIINTINDKISNGTVQVKVVDTTKPSTVLSGTKSVTLNTSQLSNTTTRLVSGVHIKASLNNTGVVYVGGRNLLNATSEGYPLEAGESIFLEVSSLTSVYVRSEQTGLSVRYIAT
jgi:hypothetical protein